MKNMNIQKNIKRCIMLGAMLALFNYTEIQAAAPTEASANQQEWEVLKIANEERAKGGKEALSTFNKLQSAAGVRAKELIELFSHTRPDGTSCFTAVTEKGISYRALGENIAAGYVSPKHVMEGWMNSPGHKSNIMSESMEFNHMGVGYTTGGDYGTNWVQMFVGGCTTQKIEVGGINSSGYNQGTSIADLDLYVKVNCDMHGESYMPLSKDMCSGYKPTQTGTQAVTVKHHDVETKFNILIKTTNSNENGDDDEVQKVKKPSKVTNLKVKKVSSKKVKLTWKKTKASGYEIYMKAGSGKYKKIKTITKGSKTSYTVKKLKKKTKYSFKIRAYNQEGSTKKYGKYSSVKKIKL